MATLTGSLAHWRSAQDELLAQLEDSVYDSEEDNEEWAHNRDTPHHSEDPPEREGPSSQSANIHERIYPPQQTAPNLSKQAPAKRQVIDSSDEEDAVRHGDRPIPAAARDSSEEEDSSSISTEPNEDDAQPEDGSMCRAQW